VRTFADFEAVPPIHTLAGSGATALPEGMTPAQVKTAYLLPSTGGSGTIAIVSAYEHRRNICRSSAMGGAGNAWNERQEKISRLTFRIV
jgi:hypothetical protein